MKILTFDQILQEAVYSPKKMFYHISPNKFSKFENRNFFRVDDEQTSGVFLSPSLYMIWTYLEALIDEIKSPQYYLYRCFLNKELNIFNPSNHLDQKRFISAIKEDPKKFFNYFTLKSKVYVPDTLNKLLIRLFSQNKWRDAENPAVSSIIIGLGYDGYESTENNTTNILVFNSDNIIINGNGPFKEIDPNNQESFESFKNEVYDTLKIRHRKRDRGNVAANYGDFAKLIRDDTIKDDEVNNDKDF
jgi:hypothetical protein